MPQLKVWKHPRKKTYTENKFIHLRRLKKDAYLNFKKRRKQEIFNELRDSFKDWSPFVSFKEYVEFIDRNKILIAKLNALADNLPIYQYDTSDIVTGFLDSITGICIGYNGKHIVGIDLIRDKYYQYNNTTHRTLSMLIPMMVGVQSGQSYTSNAFRFPFTSRVAFNDIVALSTEARLEQERETVLNRLADEGKIELPDTLWIPDQLVCDLKMIIMDQLVPHKPLTLDAIGERVIVFTDHEPDGPFVGTHGMYHSTLVAYTKTQAIVAYRGMMVAVNPNNARRL